MRTNFQTWLNSLTNDDGSGTTGDLLNIAWFTDQMDVIGGDLDDIDADITALQNVGFLTGYDSVLFTYKDADTITLQANGQFTVSDNSTIVKIAANTDLKLSTGLTTGQTEAANTLYYVWGGVDSLGATKFYFSNSAVTMPTELVKGKRIRGAVRNNNSSNIMPFYTASDWMFYNVDAVATGSDETEVLDSTVSTSFVDVNCAGFLPTGARTVLINVKPGGTVYAYVRVNGSSVSRGTQIGQISSSFATQFITQVDSTGIFDYCNSGSSTTRISLIAYKM